MVSAAELVDVLQRRAQLRGRRPPGEFPPGWQRWFAEMGERVGAVTGATADAVLDLILLRPLAAAPGRSPQLTRRQAFFALWHQDWRPVAPDERRWHWTAIAFTTLWHAFFAAMLLWLMYLQYLIPPAAPEGEDVVMVQYVGRGAPEEPGGGWPPARGPRRALVARVEHSLLPHPARPAAATASAAEPQPPATPVEPVPQPQPPTAQPVAVSEPVPSTPKVEFVLPPVNRRVVDPVSVPQLQAPTTDVAVVDIPAPIQAPAMRAPMVTAPQPSVTAPSTTVTVREVPVPLQRIAVPTLPSAAVPTPQMRTTTPDVAMRTVPTPSAAASPSATSSASTQTASASAPASGASSTSPSSAANASSGPASATSNAPTTKAGTGTGPKATPAPGSFPTPRKDDDWGDATRNQPGGKRGTAGLYDSNGRLKLGEPPGSASGGPPPGSLTQEIKDLDRAGTWLKRKPNDYQATSFDRYWVPSGTLLEEWVRKGIKQVAIPIPGSNKRIVCVVSLLQFGGGCGVSDPNLNDQPAVARPPPDIPFKPELQEDNGSVRKPPGG